MKAVVVSAELLSKILNREPCLLLLQLIDTCVMTLLIMCVSWIHWMSCLTPSYQQNLACRRVFSVLFTVLQRWIMSSTYDHPRIRSQFPEFGSYRAQTSALSSLHSPVGVLMNSPSSQATPIYTCRAINPHCQSFLARAGEVGCRSKGRGGGVSKLGQGRWGVELLHYPSQVHP